jgi:hypothetical protein
VLEERKKSIKISDSPHEFGSIKTLFIKHKDEIINLWLIMNGLSRIYAISQMYIRFYCINYPKTVIQHRFNAGLLWSVHTTAVNQIKRACQWSTQCSRYITLMNAYIVLVTAAFLIAATAISVNTMTAYARSPENMIGGGANMTGNASKLSPSGSAKGIVAQGEKIFIVVCPRDFQTIKQCEIFVAQPTLTAIKTVKVQ